MKTIVGILMISLILIACGVNAKRGLVMMKINEATAHVSLPGGQGTLGKHVTIYRDICDELLPKDPRRSGCNKTKIGTGVITELLNDHYVVVTFSPSIAFKEGDFVEAN